MLIKNSEINKRAFFAEKERIAIGELVLKKASLINNRCQTERAKGEKNDAWNDISKNFHSAFPLT